MNIISWSSIGFYCLFSVFVYYQQLQGRDFKGESQSFGLALNLFGFAGMLTGFAYLLYYGWTVSWWGPIVAFAVGLVAMVPGTMIERLVGRLTMSIAGFVIWPLAAYMMFHHVPN